MNFGRRCGRRICMTYVGVWINVNVFSNFSKVEYLVTFKMVNVTHNQNNISIQLEKIIYIYIYIYIYISIYHNEGTAGYKTLISNN